ncbi:hypothetical protein Rs2_25782 [Raphanus sativus]|uniref:Uncharacterized protein LOC108812803 n=1 Tax=Raphanus sativus TaxID=3726 RepID=A0A6J0JY35_RAPSA|nr:uncharacterized protein LOC108812803 [Raphanus sativus]XP_056843797.1 uncharacterized protein LOC108812803 [Raphanus sativus]XP_056843798.1 uncharacterized protein LOC108812803 [Raphanus sativus]KAJ4886034.1 hypothetical protein Rs2_25782 [Raphanus sativus]
MSRCFPFPPPGYEKKIRNDEADSLIKEKKKKEKKHKKEKKDKEKKEGKDSKDKDTSKDKHKERKEKKEKHKDRKDKDRNKEKSTTSEDKKAVGVLPNTGDREKLVVSNTLHSNGNGESKFIQDLARRIRDEEEATESQSVGKIRNDDDERRINNTHKNFAMEKRPENAVRQVLSCTGQKGTEVMFKPLENKKDQAKKMEVEENRVITADTPLDSGGIEKSEPKYTTDRSSKDKKEAETKADQGKPKDVEGGTKLKERDVDTRNFRVQQNLSRESVKNLTSGGILGKRKDLETNGFLHENGSRPKKIQRPVASPVSSVENGRKLEACQTPLKPVSALQEAMRNPEAKEQRVNGFIKSPEPKSHPKITSVKAKENGEASSAKKRPHSDLKYLDQILNVPEREELHEVDESEEQEWLFGQSGMKLSKKPKTVSTISSDDSLQVWNQSLSIESADIVALPYVVPF